MRMCKRVHVWLQRPLTRASPGAGGLQGVHYLQDTIQLGSEHSYITFTNYQDETPEVNGGQPLTTNWLPYNTSLSITVSSILPPPPHTYLPTPSRIYPHPRTPTAQVRILCTQFGCPRAHARSRMAACVPFDS